MQDSEMPDDEESNYIHESQYDPQLEKKILKIKQNLRQDETGELQDSMQLSQSQ